MHPDRAHSEDLAIAEKILQIAQAWREPAVGAENGLHTSFCRKVDQFSRGLRVRRQGPLAVHGLPRSDRFAYRFLVLRTCREHEDDVDVWMANQFIDRSDDMPDTEGVRSRLRGVATLAVDSRHFILRHKFPTPIRPTRMIVWLAEGALLSAIVDEVDMGFSCLLKSLSVVFVSSIIRLFSIGPFGICEKWTPWKPSACT